MTAGQWLADSGSGFRVALASCSESLAAGAVPAVPYAFLAGWVALGTALALVAAMGGAISWLRPERGALAVE